MTSGNVTTFCESHHTSCRTNIALSTWHICVVRCQQAPWVSVPWRACVQHYRVLFSTRARVVRKFSYGTYLCIPCCLLWEFCVTAQCTYGGRGWGGRGVLPAVFSEGAYFTTYRLPHLGLQPPTYVSALRSVGMISQMKLQLTERTVIRNLHIGTSLHMPIVIVVV